MKIIYGAILFFVAFYPTSVSAQANAAEIKGEIADQNGAVVAGASIGLIKDGKIARTTVSDSSGSFVFKNLAAGAYVIRVEAVSFPVYEKTVSLENTRKPVEISIILTPEIKESVTVDANSASPLDAERAAGTLNLSRKELDALPDDPDALAEQIQQLAATSGGSPGGAMVSVDGFMTGGRLPPKSAIASIRINPNVYSADYDTPPFRAGHIEITTKPGSTELSGSAFFNFNDAVFNAREAFAATRARTQVRQYGFQIGAPIVKRRSGFFLDFERREINDSATVNAVNLDGAFVANVPTPKRLLIGSGRADWQLGKNRAQVFRFDFNSNKLAGQGAGGFDFPERAYSVRLDERNFRFTDSLALNVNSSNELRFGLTLQNFSQRAASDEATISVAGAFTAGGANLQFLERGEKRVEIVDNFVSVAGKHNFKAGTQITFRRVEDSREENPNGSFYFGGVAAAVGSETISPLEQYRRTLLGELIPTRFSITLGSPSVAVNQWRVAGFAQDEWQWRKNITLSLGFRYETQTAPADFAGFAPRVGFSYSPDKKQNWVLRARAGIFYERVGEQLTLETLRLDGNRQREILIDKPSFPNPFADGAATNAIPARRVLDSALRPPMSLQTRVDVERTLPGNWRVMATGSWTRGWFNLRSRNINAPLVSTGNPNPRTAPRPFGVNENILQFESSGRTEGKVFFVGVYQMSKKYFNLYSGYTFSDFKTNADTPFSFPQSSYDDDGEWARPLSQSRHRAFVTGIFSFPKNFRTVVILNAASGTPFNITTGKDNNGDGNFNDRPGFADRLDAQAIQTAFGLLTLNSVAGGSLPRNAGTSPATVTVDLNFRRTFVLAKKNDEVRRALAFSVRVANVFNRTNPLNVNGVLTSPFFGHANAAAAPRRIELSARLNF